MRIGLYPFPSQKDISKNLTHIHDGFVLAKQENVDLLVFHECALCGYPPLETEIELINEDSIQEALNQVRNEVLHYSIGCAIGTIRYENGSRYNSMVVFNEKGEEIGRYDKSSLWGYDLENFQHGQTDGLMTIKDIKVGFRICFDIRFPELFRKWRNKVDVGIVCFSDTSETYSQARYDIIKAHLITRAVENVVPILSVNSLSFYPTAPNLVLSSGGQILHESNQTTPHLFTYDLRKQELTFGERGIHDNANRYQIKEE